MNNSLLLRVNQIGREWEQMLSGKKKVIKMLAQENNS